MTWLRTFWRNLMADAGDLDPQAREQAVRIVVGLGVAVVVLSLLSAGGVASSSVAPRSAWWEFVTVFRFGLARTFLAIPLLVLGAAAGHVLYNAVETSAVGARLFLPLPGDPDPVKAVKVALAGLNYALITLGAILGLLVGVLK